MYQNDCSAQQASFADDIVEAYLDLVPADDDMPIDEAWLRSLGFMREMQPAASNHLTARSVGGAMHVTRWLDKPIGRDPQQPPRWSVNQEWLSEEAQPTTRGQVRSLLKALGINIPSPSKEESGR